MLKNIVIVALFFICLVISVYSFIQVGIAEAYLKEATENMNQAVGCSHQVQKMKQQLEMYERELANRNKELASAIEEARTARAKAIQARK